MAKVSVGDERYMKATKFTMDKDQTARICVLDKDFDHEIAHYLAKEKYKEGGYFSCTRDGSFNTGGRCLYCESKDPNVAVAKDRFRVDIVRYRTNWDGVPDNPPEIRLEEWIFNSAKYGDLSKIVRKVGDIRQVDLNVECTDKKFQNYKIQAEPGKALWLSDERSKAKVISLWKERQKKKDSSVLARVTTLSEQKIILSGEALRDKVDNVPVMNEAVGSDDLDALLQDVSNPSSISVATPEESPTAVEAKDRIPMVDDIDILLGEVEKGK